MPHRSRAAFGRPLPAHVTLRIRDDVPSLRTVPFVREIERSFRQACVRASFRLVHYSLQGNHAHLIVEASDRDALGRGMKSIGPRIARAIHRTTEHSGPVLADRYHVRPLRTPREVRNALRYVLLNAQHHMPIRSKALRVDATLDPASSARWFDGWKFGINPVVSARRAAVTHDPRPVARARTWLLAVGWRRHGLLDPAEVPG